MLLPLPLGTETVLEPDRVQDRGFKRDEKIIGMDFPDLPSPGLFAEDSAFGVIVHEVIRALKRQLFKVIVVVNGDRTRCASAIKINLAPLNTLGQFLTINMKRSY